jgi:hypothetical protein
MQTQTRPPPPASATPGKRFGYFIGAGINVVLIYVVQNLVAWDWFPWLTEDFNDVVPIITASLVVSAVANVLYVLYDRQWFKSLTQLGVLGVGLAATIRFYQIFPFDFSAYDFRWDTVAKALLIIGIVGSVIGIVVEFSKLARAVGRP